MEYPSSEHAFQASKTTNFKEKQKIAGIPDVKQVKKEGKLVALREDWEQVKIFIMYRIVYAKFQQNPSLRDSLLKTGNAWLIEGNNWGDTFWGMCHGEGKNWLGKILMEVRKNLRKEFKTVWNDEIEDLLKYQRFFYPDGKLAPVLCDYAEPLKALFCKISRLKQEL